MDKDGMLNTNVGEIILYQLGRSLKLGLETVSVSSILEHTENEYTDYSNYWYC